MAEDVHDILVVAQTPEDFLSWSPKEKLRYYEATVDWHVHISRLMSTGDVSKAWGTLKLPGRVRPVATRTVVLAIYRTTLQRFSELIVQEPLWDLAWYEAPILKSIEGDYEDDVARHQRLRKRLQEKSGVDLAEAQVRYLDEVPKFQPGELEVLTIMRNEPTFGLLSDLDRLAQDEHVLQMHDYHRQLREAGLIAAEWGTYQNCGFGVWAGGVRAEGVMLWKASSYDEFDVLFQSDPVRGDSRVRTLVLAPFAVSWQNEEQQLERAKARLR